jgi:hypothetical protein
MNERIRHPEGWLWLTVPIAILLAMAAGGGIFIPGLYRDNPNIAAQAVGQDYVSLAVVLPTLLISAMLSRRGSAHAWLIWLGAVVYLVYSYVVMAFAIRFNPLFLVYIALLGCSLYALIGGLGTLDMAGIQARFTPNAPVKAVSIYLAVVVILFYRLWLSEIVPALATGELPQSVQDDETPTNAVHVVDMAWLLPACAITAVSLWRKQPLGYTLAGVMLCHLAFLVLSILSMAVFQLQGGRTLFVPEVMIFVAVFAANLAMLIWYLKGLESAQRHTGRPLGVGRAA